MNEDQQARAAKRSPSARFSSPQDVLAHSSFSERQKREILEQWKDEEEQLDVAAGEGMWRGEASLLQRVCLVLAKLVAGEIPR